MKSVRWFLLLAVMMVSGLVSVPVQAQPQDVPFNVEPKVGSAGTRFAFVAFGFRGNERVGVWLNTPDGRAIAARVEQLNRATREGRVDWFWRAPANIQPGAWQMVARGIDSGVQRIIGFQIAGDAPPAAPPQAPPTAPPAIESNVEPKVGGAGTRFAFVAFGFRGNERVGVWLNTPDGRAIAARAEQLNRATREGRVDWFWRAPAGIQPGTWQMVARGIDSGVQRIIPVEIR